MTFGSHIQFAGPWLSAAINFAASGDNTLVAAHATKKIFVCRLFLVVAGATDLTFKSGATSLTGAMPMLANGSIVLDPTDAPWLQNVAVNSAMILNSSNAVQVSGALTYGLQ